jgi:hypothetical protein
MVQSAKVSALGGCGLGLDGVSYELSLEEGAARASYQWWATPSTGWDQLSVICEQPLARGGLDSTLDFAGFGPRRIRLPLL